MVYIMNFPLQNLNVSIYYITNNANTFNDFLLAKIYGCLIIYV